MCEKFIHSQSPHVSTLNIYSIRNSLGAENGNTCVQEIVRSDFVFRKI